MEKLTNLKGISLQKFAQYLDSISDNVDAIMELEVVIKDSINESDDYVIFAMVAQQFSECFEDGLYGIEKFINKFKIEQYELEQTNLVYLVIQKENLTLEQAISDKQHFINLLQCYFFFSVVYSLVENDDANLLADFIFSVSCSCVKEWSDQLDWVNDEALNCIRYAMGIDLEDYDSEGEKNFAISCNTFYIGGIDTQYDYISFCQEIIDSYI